MSRPLSTAIFAAAAVAIVLGSCTPEESVGGKAVIETSSPASATLRPDTTESHTPSTTVTDGPTVVGCDRKTIGEASGPLAVAYGVIDGRIADEPCFGDPSVVVEAAWNDLAAITPPNLIDGVTIVAGFNDDAGDTLAYAAPVSNESDDHLIAVGVDAAVADPEELRLTMAHELAHVFGQTPDQIDVATFADECDTFYNGFGCFTVDAYVTAWVDQFWPQALIFSLPDDYSVDIVGGEERCAADPTFPGSYAAGHPEEDFAESFSAYVFDVDLPTALDERLAFFDEYPEFVAMREAVRAERRSAPPNNFDRCG